jgi:hypothetical protein
VHLSGEEFYKVDPNTFDVTASMVTRQFRSIGGMDPKGHGIGGLTFGDYASYDFGVGGVVGGTGAIVQSKSATADGIRTTVGGNGELDAPADVLVEPCGGLMLSHPPSNTPCDTRAFNSLWISVAGSDVANANAAKPAESRSARSMDKACWRIG